MKFWKCTGFVTKVTEMYVGADSEEEAWEKIEDGDIIKEKEVGDRDIEMERNTLMEIDEPTLKAYLRRKYLRKKTKAVL